MKVKIFDVLKSSELEERINDFLASKYGSIEVIDIKFNSYSYGNDNVDCHSAMVIYKNK